MNSLICKILTITLVILMLLLAIGFSLFYRQKEVNGVIIHRELYEHQSFFENRKFSKLIRKTLNKDEKSLAKLNNFWCGGAAGCYDLGFVITQIIYKIGEQDFIKMVDKLENNKVLGLRSLISAGLEYGDNDKDGKMDNKRIEDEFPDLNMLLKAKEKNFD